jgi:hypothetical protein
VGKDWLKCNIFTSKIPRQNPIEQWHLNNEGQEHKTGHVKEGTNETGRVNEEGKEGWICMM